MMIVMYVVYNRRIDQELLRPEGLHTDDPTKTGPKPLFPPGYISGSLSANLTTRVNDKVDSVIKPFSKILQEEFVIKEDKKSQLLGKKVKMKMKLPVVSKKTVKNIQTAIPGGRLKAHDQNQRRTEELNELYNKIAANVALRIAQDNLTSKNREGTEEDDKTKKKPYFYGLDGSGSFLGDALNQPVSIFVTHEARDKAKKRNRSVGGTVPKDAQAIQRRSVLYLNLVNEIKLLCSTVFVKDKNFLCDIEIKQVCVNNYTLSIH
jgi:hypothetical protein